jgi:hypothetical protein
VKPGGHPEVFAAPLVANPNTAHLARLTQGRPRVRPASTSQTPRAIPIPILLPITEKVWVMVRVIGEVGFTPSKAFTSYSKYFVSIHISQRILSKGRRCPLSTLRAEGSEKRTPKTGLRRPACRRDLELKYMDRAPTSRSDFQIQYVFGGNWNTSHFKIQGFLMGVRPIRIYFRREVPLTQKF